jgi:hypothetical protein
METPLAAFVVIFIILFAVLTLSHAMISGQDTLVTSWHEMETRLEEQGRTNLVAVEARTRDAGQTAEITLTNAGSVKLADFNNWDVFVQYMDSGAPEAYHIERLAYVESEPTMDEWSIKGIYARMEPETPESFEPGVLNPGEMMTLELMIAPSAGPGETITVILSTSNGVSTSAYAIRNIPPSLTTNNRLTIGRNEVGAITPALLEITDPDDVAEDIVYTVTLSPVSGDLSLATSFTQEVINNAALTYSNDLSGDYTFEFTVTDGEDEIGPYVFDITVVNAAPMVVTNTGVTISSGDSITISSAMLAATDADDAPADLTYSVTTMSTQGVLNPGPVFSQQHIDSGLLQYTHTGSGSDSFTFTVSDGEKTTASYQFSITVP